MRGHFLTIVTTFEITTIHERLHGFLSGEFPVENEIPHGFLGEDTKDPLETMEDSVVLESCIDFKVHMPLFVLEPFCLDCNSSCKVML